MCMYIYGETPPCTHMTQLMDVFNPQRTSLILNVAIFVNVLCSRVMA
jgi:hypothetical protein